MSVEIGVYGGRSLLPVAYAHKMFTNGMAWGIDPWDKSEAMQIGFDSINETTQKINFDALYQGVLWHVDKFDLKSHCTLLRMKSQDAVNRFNDGEIDLLHIDGNHGEQAVLDDITAYLPKIKVGGVVWFDDVAWASTAKAINYAKAFCTVIGGSGNDIVLEKTNL